MPSEQLQPRAVASTGGGDRAEAGEVVMVRRSAIAPRLTCGLCGRILRDATTVSECLHSFCSKCIFKKFEDEDITCCPTCSTDLGCHPLEKLRADHSLTCIRLMVFPVKRRKIEGISLLHPALVSQPYHLPHAHEVGQSAKKTDAFFAGESMNGEAETEAVGSFGMEPTASPTKTSISAPAEEIGTFIVTVEKENRERAAAESTLSSVVDSTAEGRAALPLVASQREIHEVEGENTGRTLEKVGIYIGRSQSLQADNTRLREELENERAEKTAVVEIVDLSPSHIPLRKRPCSSRKDQLARPEAPHVGEPVPAQAVEEAKKIPCSLCENHLVGSEVEETACAEGLPQVAEGSHVMKAWKSLSKTEISVQSSSGSKRPAKELQPPVPKKKRTVERKVSAGQVASGESTRPPGTELLESTLVEQVVITEVEDEALTQMLELEEKLHDHTVANQILARAESSKAKLAEEQDRYAKHLATIAVLQENNKKLSASLKELVQAVNDLVSVLTNG